MELLQNKLRPTSLKDVLGQTHIIGIAFDWSKFLIKNILL